MENIQQFQKSNDMFTNVIATSEKDQFIESFTVKTNGKQTDMNCKNTTWAQCCYKPKSLLMFREGLCFLEL